VLYEFFLYIIIFSLYNPLLIKGQKDRNFSNVSFAFSVKIRSSIVYPLAEMNYRLFLYVLLKLY